MEPIVNENDLTGLFKADKLFKKIFHEIGAPPVWQREQGFESLCRIILEQQVSLQSAFAHYTSLKNFVEEFSPEKIAALTPEEMRSCNVSRQKAMYIKGLAEAIISGHLNLNALANHDELEIRRQLTSLKGIGTWTADIYLLMCLQKKDIFPLGDIAVIAGAKKITGLKTRDEIEIISAQWQPYRSLAACFCWHVYLQDRKRIVPG